MNVHMMHIYKIDGNTLQVVCCPPEDVRKGDYLLINDVAAKRGLIAQVVNTGYANVPGILEDILREPSAGQVDGKDLDPLETKAYVNIIKDAKSFTCKIRRGVVNERLDDDISWVPSRSTSRVERLPDEKLIEMAGLNQHDSIDVGTTKSGAKVSIGLSSLDGKLNIITGKKETGKSHLSKLLVLGLISKGGICVVFDINGEYVNLGYTSDGRKGPFYDRIIVLSPGENFKVTLKYAGLNVLLNVMSSVLDLPATSAWEFRRIWDHLVRRRMLSLRKLGEAIQSVKNNYVQDALLRRYESLVSTGFFTDHAEEAITLEDVLTKIKGGGALVFNLQNLPPTFRRIIVEFLLSKFTHLLRRWVVRAIFLFAEEAHLYLRDTYWDDVVTRMRHLGVFTTFITNQPDSISEGIYRQADNIFLFNFTNENDLETVSRATRVDIETVNIIARELPPHHCLMLGKAVEDFPLIVKINPLNAKTMGQTRLFFTSLRQLHAQKA